ncbi:restriction endonuclease subunit S [Alcanivorax sp. MM125-6]|nr:restriction endonuclease subunit S [Alcanivorax sp. MM125-6]
MAERSEAVEEQAVRDGSAAYAIEPEIETAEGVPPGYKRTEVGVIPEDWECIEISRLLSDISMGPFGSDIKVSNFVKEGVPVLDGFNVRTERLLDDFSKFVTESKAKSLKKAVARRGDVVITHRGTIGQVSFIPYNSEFEKYVISQSQFRARFNSSVLPQWVTIFFLSESGSRRLLEGKGHTGVPALAQPTTTFRKLKLPVPSGEEQRAIATALSDADALIESLDRLVAKKRAIKQAATQQLLTGQTRLPGFTGEWKTKRLGDHVAFLKTGTNSRAELTSSGSVAYLHYGDIHVGASVMLNPNAVSVPHIAASKVCHVDKLAPGDLVFVDASEDLDGVGKSVEIIDVPKGGMVAGLHTIAARFDKDVLADGFKAYLQFCPRFIGILRRLAAGTKVLATNRQHIASVELRLPGTSEQNAIATVLSDMDTELEALERRRDKARQIKQGMMQQLLTGRVRLVVPQTTEPVAC